MQGSWAYRKLSPEDNQRACQNNAPSDECYKECATFISCDSCLPAPLVSSENETCNSDECHCQHIKHHLCITPHDYLSAATVVFEFVPVPSSGVEALSDHTPLNDDSNRNDRKTSQLDDPRSYTRPSKHLQSNSVMLGRRTGKLVVGMKARKLPRNAVSTKFLAEFFCSLLRKKPRTKVAAFAETVS